MADKRFEESNIEKGFAKNTTIIIDKETGVNYLWHTDGYAGGLTVLVDENGKPIVTPNN
ncbi:DUF6440 family protein [Lactiplantibacillus herbarum]|uniref:DUF6440 family protein n=1 Tax=Lactiplantibacillus herbarum TaxID=1670446 RepID=UPI00064E3EB6|nr:DUF6440 family protein [Lactiplantibacillus herbarum]